MKEYVYYDVYHRKRRMPFFFLRKLLQGKSGAFFFCFLLALVAGRICFWEQMAWTGQWLGECMQQLDVKSLDQQQLFGYLLLHRGMPFLLLVLFGLTRIRKVLFYLVCMAGGILAGGLCLASVSAYGIKGLLFFAASLFPHGVAYVILFLYLFWVFCERQETEALQEKKYLKLGMYGMLYTGVALFLLFAGIYLEGAINPMLLGWLKPIL
jgi:hypothetical protein